MKCIIMGYPSPTGPHGPAKFRCETHNIPLELRATSLCPIGRIEQATEEALKKIEYATEALAKITADAHRLVMATVSPK